MSRELHDAVGQSLNTLLIQIRLVSAKGQAGRADLQELEITTQRALDETRALAYDLRERSDDPFEATQRIGETMLAQQGCTLAWIDERTDTQLAPRVASEISAVIREALTNIVRHARAAGAVVRLESLNGTLRVTIRDDGIGFLPGLVTLSSDGRGLGLQGMDERLRAIGGSLNVSSAPDAGTTILLQVPRRGAQPSVQRTARTVGRECRLND